MIFTYSSYNELLMIHYILWWTISSFYNIHVLYTRCWSIFLGFPGFIHCGVPVTVQFCPLCKHSYCSTFGTSKVPKRPVCSHSGTMSQIQWFVFARSFATSTSCKTTWLAGDAFAAPLHLNRDQSQSAAPCNCCSCDDSTNDQLGDMLSLLGNLPINLCVISFWDSHSQDSLQSFKLRINAPSQITAYSFRHDHNIPKPWIWKLKCFFLGQLIIVFH